MDRESNSDQIKKLYPKKAQDLFLTNKDKIHSILENMLFEFIDIYKIEDPFTSDEEVEKNIESIFNKLLFDDSIVIEFGDKSLIIDKKDIINKINNN